MKETVDIVLPVYNEEKDLRKSVEHLIGFLRENNPHGYDYQIIIADNNSTDSTPTIGTKLQDDYDIVKYHYIPRKGRGFALHEVWDASTADVISYMDIDLSTDLRALDDLITPLILNKADVSYGSRLSQTSKVKGRKVSREILSRGYNFLLKSVLSAQFNDAQCGFKALRNDAWKELSPQITDNEWFFDTELLYVAQQEQYRLNDVPVFWTDDPNSTVHVGSTVIKDLIGMKNLYTKYKPQSLARKLFIFCIIGALTTVGFGLTYFFLRFFMGAEYSNLVSLISMTLLNIFLNKIWTFRKGDGHNILDYVLALITFALSWAISSGGLYLLHLSHWTLSRTEESLYAVGLQFFATIIKFVLFNFIFTEKSADIQEQATEIIDQLPIKVPSANKENNVL